MSECTRGGAGILCYVSPLNSSTLRISKKLWLRNATLVGILLVFVLVLTNVWVFRVGHLDCRAIRLGNC